MSRRPASTCAPASTSTAAAPSSPTKGTVWFSNFADQRLYRQDRGGEPRPITEAVDRRYADAIVDRDRGLLFAVREDHTDTSREAVNTIVALGLDGEREVVVVEGNDFYSDPRLSPDGTRLCWLAWNHPHLPWDGTELWVGTVAEDGSVGRLADRRRRRRGLDLPAVLVARGSPPLRLRRERLVEPLPARGGRPPQPDAAERRVRPAPVGVPPDHLRLRATEGRIACSWIDLGIGGFGVLEHGRAEEHRERLLELLLRRRRRSTTPTSSPARRLRLRPSSGSRSMATRRRSSEHRSTSRSTRPGSRRRRRSSFRPRATGPLTRSTTRR